MADKHDPDYGRTRIRVRIGRESEVFEYDSCQAAANKLIELFALMRDEREEED